jgi:hypothetical protein
VRTCPTRLRRSGNRSATGTTWGGHFPLGTGILLIDDGGNDDLTKGYKVDDIKDIVLTQQNGIPVQVKDIAKGSLSAMFRDWG